jgi:uncharacterized protein
VSQLADHFLKDPSTLLKGGDVVKVRVAEVDLKAQADRPFHAQGRGAAASKEVSVGNANKRPVRQPTPCQPKSMPEDSLGAALSEALRRK